MISFNLRCKNDHVFEAWFKDSAAYDTQKKGKKLSCPNCGNAKIDKAIMAPSIARGSSRGQDDNAPSPEAMRNMLLEVRAAVEQNCDYVGSEFPEEARKIHYGETEKRNIYGEATTEEVSELSEEGVEFGNIPWIQHTDS